jgi:hypothetical protein
MVREICSERWLAGGAAGEENRHKCPTLIERRMFMNIWKSYIWMWVDIMERLENRIKEVEGRSEWKFLGGWEGRWDLGNELLNF